MKKKPTALRLMDAMEFLLEEHPYEKITISMLSAQCGVSRQVFYKYYKDKEDMCDKMARRFTYEGVPEDATVTWNSLILHFLKINTNHRQFYIRMARTGKRQLLYHSMVDMVLLLYRSMIESRQGYAMTHQQEFLLHSYCGGGIQMLVQWMYDYMPIPPEELCRLFEQAMPPQIHDLLVGYQFANPKPQVIRKLGQP